MVFKILSTAAVFLFGTVWAYRNIRAINDWIASKTGITRERRKRVDDTANTDSSNTG